MSTSIARIVAEAWEDALNEAPDPFSSTDLFYMLGGRRWSYRERLDVQPKNWKQQPIPRIATVRRNLRALGNTRLDPSRMP